MQVSLISSERCSTSKRVLVFEVVLLQITPVAMSSGVLVTGEGGLFSECSSRIYLYSSKMKIVIQGEDFRLRMDVGSENNPDRQWI